MCADAAGLCDGAVRCFDVAWALFAVMESCGSHSYRLGVVELMSEAAVVEDNGARLRRPQLAPRELDHRHQLIVHAMTADEVQEVLLHR